MDKPNVCKQCGQEYFHRPVGVMTSHAGGGDTHGFCSEGCMRAYKAEQKRVRLESEKNKGEKQVRRWQKQREKLGKRIDKLQSVLSGNDPSAIARARGAGLFGLIKTLLCCFMLICTIIGLATISLYVYAVGVKGMERISIENGMERISLDLYSMSLNTTTNLKDTTAATDSDPNNIDELPSLEENTNTSTNTISPKGLEVNVESTQVEHE